MAWQAQLKAWGEERNKWVHLSLLKWDIDTLAGYQAILTELDS